MGVKIEVIKDKLPGLLGVIKQMDAMRVYVGIPGDAKKREGEQTNAQIGYVNEVGSPANHIPPTPFLKPGVEKVQDKCIKILRKTGENVFENEAALKKGLETVGLIAQNSVKGVIQKQEGFKPLSNRTILERQAKGFKGTKRLIRSGQLINSITYVVRPKNASN